MNLEECYRQMGGDYKEICTRIPTQALIERFIGKFLQDKSYEQLCAAVREGNRAEAFRTAHTLKGVCANLSFTALRDSVSRLTELLRGEGDALPEAATGLMQQVSADWQRTAAAIRTYLGVA